MSRPGGSLDEMEATSTLFTRAWVFQERLLSSRLLYFGKRGICWSCKLGHAYEGDPDGMMFPRDPGSPFDEGGMCRNPVSSFKWLLQNSVSGSKVEDILHYLWFDIVYEYSSSAMTKPKDKLIALSGIAQRLKDCTGEEYLAGHWKCTLFPDLLWHVSGPRSARPSEFRAPSWSWASVDGTIASDDPGSVDDLKMSSMATLIDAEVSTQPADTHKTGQILGAYLKFTGRIKRAPRFGNPASGFYSDIEDVVNGPRTIGKVYIDAVTPAMSDVYFMPLWKTEEKGAHTHGKGNWCQRRIQGLALYSEGSGFRRFGMFSLECIHGEELQFFDSFGFQYFDDCEERDIIFDDMNVGQLPE